jgi:hypothetical protein
MSTARRWSLILVITGLVLMIVGAIDPLEGSLVILPGAGLAALGAYIGKSRHRAFLFYSFALAAIGVGALFAVSAVGGFGGSTGRSYWWALVCLPYPIGWVMGIIGIIRTLRERPSVDEPEREAPR